jgi:23S rRNA (adenine2503-C2)-methyltransferase
MDYKHGNSICISTQVGCKMGCKFCASTIAGFKRNLLPSEMLLQIYEQKKTAVLRLTALFLWE